MPNISNVHVYNLEESIKAAKYPMAVDISKLNSELTKGIQACASCGTGEGHDNFLNGIAVTFDLTFSNKAFIELERYHHIDFICSQSTIHRLNKFDIKSQCNRYVDPRIIDILNNKVKEYNRLVEAKANPEPIKEARLEMLYNTPAGFELTAAMVTNYRQLKTIYQQRRNHILPDWQMFCDWVESLPRFLELTQPNLDEDVTK
jgi:hypothetical protein